MSQVILAESPLQILSAYEAKLAFRSQEAHLVLRLSGRASDDMLLRTAAMLGWPKPHCLRVRWLGSLGFYAAALVLLRRLSGGAKGRLAFLHLGDWRSWWMHVIQAFSGARRAVFLDDGSATLRIQTNYIAQGIHRPPRWRAGRGSLVERATRMVVAALDRHQGGLTSPELFTAFALDPAPGQRITRHQWIGLRRMMSQRPVDSSLVLYFGSKYSEVGIMTLEDELSQLEFAHEHYRRAGRHMTYVPHRGDSPAKIMAIEKTLGIPIERTEIPAELHICLRPTLPGHIAAAYSTVLVTLPAITDFQSVVAFRLRPDRLAANHRETIALVYREYQRSGITLVAIPTQTIPVSGKTAST